MIRHVATAHRETMGDVLGEAVEVASHALEDRLQRFEPGHSGTRVYADTFSCEMIHRNEHRSLAFPGKRRRQVGAPHGVHGLGNDGASWFRGLRGEPTRTGASRSLPRISRSTRRNEARVPVWRNRAKPCSGLRHGSGWRPARRGSPPPEPHRTSRPLARAVATAACRAPAAGGDKCRSGRAARRGRPPPGHTACLQDGDLLVQQVAFDQRRPSRAFSRSLSSSSLVEGFWDTLFVQQIGPSVARIAADLNGGITDRGIQAWSKARPSDWATESFTVAKEDAYGRLPQPNARGAYQLSDDYIGMATHAVASQLSKAGVRLAFMLNKVLGSPH